MFNRFMITAATAALIAGTGFAYAQGTGASKEAPAATPGTQQSAPSATPMNREGGAEHGMKSTQSQEKMQPQGTKAQQAQDMKSPAREEKSAQDNMKGEKSKSTQSEERSKSTQNEKGAAGKDMKAEGREDRTGNTKAEGREERGNMKAEGREGRSETVGQAGAGSKLTTEQRTRITTVIRDQHVAPVSNVNFAVSIGTRVPRDIGFHPLPAEIVTIYPEWRGYEFFLVRNEIVVVDPRTLEIVAVLEA
jgi:Protein of unknown function (DUF1236)